LPPEIEQIESFASAKSQVSNEEKKQVEIENLEEETKEDKLEKLVDELAFNESEEDKMSNCSARVNRKTKIPSMPDLDFALQNLVSVESRKRSGSFSRIAPPLPAVLNLLSKKETVDEIVSI